MIDNLKDILKTHKKVGIFVSGGFDSALLLYLCCEFDNSNEFTIFVIDRPNKSLHFNNIVLDWINKKFNKNLKAILIGNKDAHHSVQVKLAVIDSIKFPLDVVLLGDTANPKELPPGPNRGKSTSSRVLRPFYEFTKDQLVKIALKFNVGELLDITGTCGEGKIPECGMCWPCQEKKWALLQNGIVR
jgi:7-cyano-7-deazaguanine synthase in queuosine biosynthesis